MKVTPLLKILAEKGGSDLYLSTGAPPSAKFSGKLTPLGKDSAPPGWVEGLANEIMNDKQREAFQEKPEMNLALSLPNIGRFRVNIFKQRNECSMVIRNIVTDIPNLKDLGLPDVLTKVIMLKRGLILFVGGTGSGKSTSLAALIDHRNRNSSGHIITIEDPIEFVHDHRGCIINQREVGMDTDSFEDALKNTLRQAPDVILIGEIRDRETMEHALAFAETGHLCLCTLHANSTNQALDRIINFFPEERRSQLLMDLSLNLKGVISQRLIPLKGGDGRVPAVEIMLATPMMSDLIFKGEVHAMKELISKSNEYGMKTFDQALFDLYEDGLVTYEDALRNADSINDLRLRIKLQGKDSKKEDIMDGLEGLQIEQDEKDNPGRMR